MIHVRFKSLPTASPEMVNIVNLLSKDRDDGKGRQN